MHKSFLETFATSPVILTEGAVGQRLIHEFGITPDRDILYAGLIYDDRGRDALKKIYRSYLAVAQRHRLPMLLMTNTRRAGRERMEGSRFHSRNVMGDYARFLAEIVEEDYAGLQIHIGGMLGCKGDAYSGAAGLPQQEAYAYHAWQIERFRDSGIAYFYVAIMPALPEILGMCQALQGGGLPYIVSLMLGPDGKLPDGTPIHRVIDRVDSAMPRPPLCYMSNCVYPETLRQALRQVGEKEAVRKRFLGLQANASAVSPEKLDGAGSLRTEGIEKFVGDFALLHREFPLKIVGGCCGTDHRYMEGLAARLPGK